MPTAAMSNPSSYSPDYPPPPPWSEPPSYQQSPPDEPPPSYNDATHSETSPLLVGPPPDYGMFRAYPEPDEESSVGSSEIEVADRSWAEWFGQALVVSIFIAIIYSFWKFVNDPSDGLGNLPP